MGKAVKQRWRKSPSRRSRSLCCSAAVGAGWTFAEHIWKRKRGDNRPNECAGDNSSSRGRIISSLCFNMMIDHLCPPALSQNSDEGRRDPCLSELKLESPEDIQYGYRSLAFFIVKNLYMWFHTLVHKLSVMAPAHSTSPCFLSPRHSFISLSSAVGPDPVSPWVPSHSSPLLKKWLQLSLWCGSWHFQKALQWVLAGRRFR